ncbi:MAG: twin-arginine translocase subunit TatC [Bacteroidaceae bacterium]|nr:twin-arginine translocase subunit TatC [Bacteroidaceae bacterium]
MTFWDHLDELRGVILRVLLATTVLSVAAFFMKDELFAVLLAPTHADFVTYRLIGADGHFTLKLVNTGLTEQFMVHMRTALYAGLLCASPYALYAIFSFVSPGLYEREKRVGVRLVGSAYVMFVTGTLINYFIVFPLAVRFLGTYQVSPEVGNMLTLHSYIDTLLGLGLVMGLVFELPVVCWLLARAGILTGDMMASYRRHAFVGILIAAAVITPTGDPFSLFAVTLPVYLLYEISIFITKHTQSHA